MLEYFKTTYDKDGMFLTNKKVCKIRKSTFVKETQTGEYEKQTYKTNQWVKETKRKRIEIEAIINIHN